MIDINEKKKQILKVIEPYYCEVHDYQEKGYDFLEKDDIFIAIHNPFNSFDMSIQLGEDKGIIFFGGCDRRYNGTEEDFILLKEDLEKIFSNKMWLLIFYSYTQERQFVYIEDAMTDDLKAEKLLYLFNGKFNIKRLKKDKAAIKTIKWDGEELAIKSFS